MLRDTPAFDRYVAHLAQMSPGDRWRVFARLNEDVRFLARVGLRKRHPEASETEIGVRLAVLLYGRALGARLGDVPDDAFSVTDVRIS